MTKAQVTNGRDQVRAKAAEVRGRAGKAAAQVAPYATSARTTARRGVHGARAWTAPRLDRTGHALEERVAPTVSAMMSRAARRIEPARPTRRRRWPFLTAGLVIAAGAMAAAAAAMNRRGSGPFARAGKTQESAPAPGTEPESAPAAGGADADGHVRTP